MRATPAGQEHAVTTVALIFLVILVWFRQELGEFLSFKLADFLDWWTGR